MSQITTQYRIMSFIVTDTIDRVGNDIQPSLSGVDVAGATFLLEQKIKRNGRVFAFSGYFRNTNKIRFQIWRPSNSTVTNPQEFRLVAETRLQPSVENAREDVCIRVSACFISCLRYDHWNNDRAFIKLRTSGATHHITTATTYV